jgi:RNA polymerase sigma-70 factor (ECF subfamily)
MQHAMNVFRRKTWVGADDLETFLERNRAFAIRLAIQIVGDRDQAEDVAQESLIRAYQSADRLKRATQPLAWLRTIVVRRAITCLQSRRPDSAQSEASIEDRSTDRLAVRHVLDRLPPDQQALLALAHGEQLSYRELAAALDIPEGTVASRLNAARAAFRKLWEENE